MIILRQKHENALKYVTFMADIFLHFISMKPKHLAEEEKVRILLLKSVSHQRVTLVGSCYKVPSKRSMSKQEMVKMVKERDLQIGITLCSRSNHANGVS